MEKDRSTFATSKIDKMKMDKKMRFRMLISVVALAIMGLGAGMLKDREVIFPEVAALAVGLWVADKRIWNVRGYEIPLLMTLSAVEGVILTRYAMIPLFVQLTVAFALSALSMSLLRIPLIPSIAAILLPVLLHTESWYYPASVALITTVMAIGTKLLQSFGLKEPLTPVSSREGLTVSTAKQWIDRYLLLLPLLVIATWHSWLFAIVPPLVIILIELSNPKNMFRSRPLSLWFTTMAVAIIGTICRMLLLERLSLPYGVSVSTSFLAAFWVMQRTRMMFPPIPALAIIPFILPDSYPLFPLEVAAGSAYAIAVPLLKGAVMRKFSWNRI